MSDPDPYHLLIRKLDEFIRKYYRNQLVRGGLYFAATFTLFLILFSLSEYIFRFGTIPRTVLFYAYLLINLLILGFFVIRPLGKLMRIGNVISHEQAAEIIGRHFREVSDKLLNTLQLKKISSNGQEEARDLIEASIDQKIRQLTPVPFKAAIDIRQNRKYLKYVLPPVAILILLLAAVPGVITEPAERIVKHNVYFEEPLPFTLSIANEKLEAMQQDDFTVEVNASGEALPSEVYLLSGELSYRMNRNKTDRFSFTFKNLQETKKFVLSADKYRSAEYELRVMPKPIILSFEVSLDYPAYTGKSDETLDNTGDLIVPEGTMVTWKFATRDTREILYRTGKGLEELGNNGSNSFSRTERMLQSSVYSVIPVNEFARHGADSVSYSVTVIPDAYPSISAEQALDSVFQKRIFFRGMIRDDYGFSRLTFNLRKVNAIKAEVNAIEEGSFEVPISASLTTQQFFYYFDLDSVMIDEGDQIAYHFQIWDNDGVNGPKSSRSGEMIFKVPTRDEIEEVLVEESENIQEKIDEARKDAQALQKKIERMNRELLEKESIGWQEKQQIEQILKDQQELKDKLEQLQKENKIKDLQEQQYKDIDEELVRKQEQLQNLFEQLMTEEMKKMIDDLKKLLEEVDKDKVSEMLEKMKMDSKTMEKELDRNLELFKHLEMEKLLQESIDQLNELTRKQEELAEETEKGSDEIKKLEEEQDQLKDDFDKLREKLDELEKKNKELEEPENLAPTDELEQEIDQDMENSLEELQNGDPAKASGSQKGAAGKMKKMAEQMMAMQSEMYMEGMEQDVGDLREILENLLQLSFDQEELIGKTSLTSTLDPKYVNVIEKQKRIKDDLVMVEDSLWALSKRVPMIESYITREITQINENVGKSLDFLNDRMKSPAMEGQQFAMTAINDLTLMLDEVLKQMMTNMTLQGNGQCKKGMPKPGQGKPSMSKMRQMQQALNEQIKKLKEGMNEGKGMQDRQGQPSQSEELVRMAAEQEALRRMMEQYREDLQEDGIIPDKEIQKLIQDMEKNETELVNKMITQESIQRLKEIETRMLKHEKAELKREQEEKRESREAKVTDFGNPGEFSEYNKLRSKEVELLKTVPPELKPYYKNKVNAYFYNVESK